MMMTMIFVD